MARPRKRQAALLEQRLKKNGIKTNLKTEGTRKEKRNSHARKLYRNNRRADAYRAEEVTGGEKKKKAGARDLLTGVLQKKEGGEVRAENGNQ